MTTLSERVSSLAKKVGYEMHNFNCGNIDNTVIEPTTEEVTTNFSIEQVISAVNTDFTNSINTAKDDFKEYVYLHAVPVGTWIDFGGTEPPSGYLVRDGSAVSRTIYAELFSVIGTTYGEGDGSTTFNLPNSIDYPYTRSVIASEVGKLFEAGLPNITGAFKVIGSTDPWIINTTSLGGAFYDITDVSGTQYYASVESNSSSNTSHQGFDASKSNSIYKNDFSEVRPKSIGSLPCIKALDAPTVTGSTTTIDELMSAVEDIRNNFMLLAHPVGSYYWSSEATDPAELFGGTWEAVTDKFIYATGTHAVGDTGGEETHTLTVDETPSHSHTPTTEDDNGYDYSFQVIKSLFSSSTARRQMATSSTSGVYASTSYSSATDYNSTNFDLPAERNTSSVGGGGSHNNMPPYEVAYCWRRTA